ncbi:MAG TPA: energy transducer TonB [Chitinophagaceae bacterium]|nr:energy transducer TonB [Chitinophagaceae bacterium]
MRIAITTLVSFLFSFYSYSQTKPFEGVIKLKVDLKSKSPDMGEDAMKVIFGVSPDVTVYTKNNKQRHTSSAGDSYYMGDHKKLYMKFRNVDTLYVVDYSKASPKPTSAGKGSEKKNIAGYDCEVFSMKGADGTHKFYYSTQLPIDPELYKGMEMGNYDMYAKATSSMWLGLEEESDIYKVYQEAVSVTPKPVDDSVFKLPSLPQAPYEIERLLITPTYDRNGGWASYLQKNLDVDLAAKYVRIPRGETSGLQSVLVKFLVTDKGIVENARVVNSKDVHSKLAQEALRVVNESGRWTPASIYGIKIPYTMQQPVTFVISKN